MSDQREPLVPGGNGAKPLTTPLRERLRRCDWTGFTQIDNVVLYSRGLTDGEKVVYFVLTSFDWPDSQGERKGYIYPGVATIAQLTGKSDRQVRRVLASLKQKGLIRTRHEGPLSTTRWIVPIHQVNWSALHPKAQSTVCPSERPDIHDTPEVSEMSPLEVSEMSPKQYEGEEYEEKQYEDRGLLADTVIDVQDTRQLVAANKVLPSEEEAISTDVEDTPFELPEPPDGIAAEVWEVLVRNYGQAAWVGALVHRARQSGRSPPLRKDFLSLWDGELERSGLRRP